MDKKAMIEALINHYTNGNKAQFAKMLGVSPQTISAWTTRHTFDSELIYTKCRYVSASWLLTGEGNMLKSSPSATPDTPLQSSSEAPSQEKDPKGKRTKQPASITDTSIVELTKIIAKQAEDLAQQGKQLTQQAREIGRLEEQVRQLTTQKARDAADAPSQDIAHVG